jgi:hypothetical protein
MTCTYIDINGNKNCNCNCNHCCTPVYSTTGKLFGRVVGGKRCPTLGAHDDWKDHTRRGQDGGPPDERNKAKVEETDRHKNRGRRNAVLKPIVPIFGQPRTEVITQWFCFLRTHQLFEEVELWIKAERHVHTSVKDGRKESL